MIESGLIRLNSSRRCHRLAVSRRGGEVGGTLSGKWEEGEEGEEEEEEETQKPNSFRLI